MPRRGTATAPRANWKYKHQTFFAGAYWTATILMSNSSEQGVTMLMAFAIVADRYTRSDEGHPRCPLSFQVLCHGSKTSTFHFCHILPKCFEATVCVRLSNNANNIFPSTELIHKNMELYQNIPNMTVKFERRFNGHFDEYVIIFKSGAAIVE